MAGAFQPAGGGGFVTKLDPAGSALAYSTYLGGVYDWGTGIAVDASGNAYVTGLTYSASFPTTAGAIQPAYGGGGEPFVAKLNPPRSALVHSTLLGGGCRGSGNGLADG